MTTKDNLNCIALMLTEGKWFTKHTKTIYNSEFNSNDKDIDVKAK